MARLRVPYGTERVAPVHARGRWKVEIGDAPALELEVPEVAVREGREVRLRSAAP